MRAPLDIDGSQGEGGGQILRTALALAAITGTPVTIRHLRAGRTKPGLQRQHLAAVRAAAQVAAATCEGATLHSTTLHFSPQRPLAGAWQFDIGSAGSTTLVLQTVLPILLSAPGPSTVTIRGGTHNPLAPPVEFLTDSLLPILRGLGVEVGLTLLRHGFYPAGGGALQATIQPGHPQRPLALADRGALVTADARILLAHLPPRIAEREALTLTRLLRWERRAVTCHDVPADGPGNALLVRLAHTHLTCICTAVGDRGRTAEDVAQEASAQVQAYTVGSGAVCPHLADQLMLPLALGAGGSYTTGEPTPHARTNAAIIGLFLGEDAVRLRATATGAWEVTVRGTAARHLPATG